MSTIKPKIIAIVGPTASGKTALSLTLAAQFQGEIISADSRQVYRGLDLGTGKVTPEEMGGIPHHLLDVAHPSTVYTASDFKRDGSTAITEILSRHHLPIIVGGTFMYLDTLLGRISLPQVPPNEALRAELEPLSNDELLHRLTVLDPARAETIDADNPRRLIRAIEVATALGSVPKTVPDSPYEVLSIGLTLPPETLHARIHDRLIARLEAGMLEEVRSLLENGVTHSRLEDLGLEYRYCSRHLRGELSYEAMVTELEAKIRQFAKRQLTWLRRDASIVWIPSGDYSAALLAVKNFLAA